MIYKLGLRKTLTSLSFLGAEVVSWGFWNCVKGDLGVAGVSVFIKFDMRDFLVVHDRGVVCNGVAGELGEI